MIPRRVAGLCALAALLAGLVALLPLQGIPHVSDEVVYTLQARLFAAGLRAGPSEPTAWVQYPFWVSEPASYGVFPPGWPALLAFGELVGAGAVVNPVLAALLPWLGWRVARAVLQEEEPAILSAAILALSPGVIVLAGSRMAHTSVLVALMAVAAFAADGRGRAFAALGLAYAVLARPFDAAAVGLPLLIAAGARWGRPAWPLLLGAAFGAALTGADNAALTGSPWTFPVDLYFDREYRPGCNSLGWGPGHGCVDFFGFGHHGPAAAARIVGELAVLFDRLFLGLPGGAALALLGLAGLRRRGAFGWALLVLVVGGYSLYWSRGLAYGARFWHPLYIALPVGAASLLWRWIGRWSWVLVTAGCALALARAGEDLSRRYWCVDGGIEQAISEAGLEEGVFLLLPRGEARLDWPTLGVEAFPCTPALAVGGGLSLNNPSTPRAGVQVRIGPPDRSSLTEMVEQWPVGTEFRVVEVDMLTGLTKIRQLTPAAE